MAPRPVHAEDGELDVAIIWAGTAGTDLAFLLLQARPDCGQVPVA